MATNPESKLVRRIITALKKAFGGWYAKIHVGQYQSAGTPDLLFCVRGWFFAFEVKTPKGGNPSAIQEYNLKKIRQAGGIGRCVRSPAEAVAVVRSTLDARSRRSLQFSERSFREGYKTARYFALDADWDGQDPDILGDSRASFLPRSSGTGVGGRSQKSAGSMV
jgi:hypothetical protein